MQIALVAGGCEADLLSWQGDFDAAAQAARDAIAFVSRSWGEWYLGGIWLAALALAAHADAAAQARLRGLDVNEAIEAGRALIEDAASLRPRPPAHRRARPRGGGGWPRAEAEWSRLQAEADPAPWEAALKAFGYGYPYEEFRNSLALGRDAGRSRAARRSGRTRAGGARHGPRAGAPLVQPWNCWSAGHGSTSRCLRLRPPAPPGSTRDGARARSTRAPCRGRTNGQIGRALFISPKTASVHVSNSIAKLGATSRTEVVALAYQRGLLDRSGSELSNLRQISAPPALLGWWRWPISGLPDRQS